jgi:1-deoxy-D-xylulose-5-phosphate synthase
VSSGTLRKSSPGAPSWTQVFSDALIQLAREDERIVAITAAMAGGTGLDRFGRAHPGRCYDVGIAEQHAVTMAAGMATEGLKPVVAIYSTFLQRGYDQIVHDVCLQNLDVTFALDRAGIVGADGATHQGLFDLAYLRALPNMILMAPRDENELRAMLRTAIEYPGPAALRFPRGEAPGVPIQEEIKPIKVGEAELLRSGEDVALLALGTMVAPALAAAEALAADGIRAAVLDARFTRPLDAQRVVELASRCGAVVTIEEHSLYGGLGEAVLHAISDAGVAAKVRVLGVPVAVIEQGNPAEQLREIGLDAAGIAAAARQLLGRS